MRVLKATLAIMKLHLKKEISQERKSRKVREFNRDEERNWRAPSHSRDISKRVQHTIFSGPLARYKRCLLLLTSIQWKSSLLRGKAGEIRAESKEHRPQDIRYSDSILRIHRRGHTTMARTQRLYRIEPLMILSQGYRVSHRYRHTQTSIMNTLLR